MIITFLLNEGADALDIADGFQAQFDEHADKLRTVQFGITEVRFTHQKLSDGIRIGDRPLDDLEAKILVVLDKYDVESIRSRAETLTCVHSTVLLHLHNSIDLRSLHLYCVPHLFSRDLLENERSTEKRCSHSCMLPNVMAGIIL
jgi:hypothetical protein